MLRFASLLVLVQLVAGCVSGNRLETAADAAAVPAGHGVLVAGLDRASELSDVGFVIEVRAIDGQGRVESGSRYRRDARQVSVALPQESWTRAKPSTTQAFALPPGDYVLTRIRVLEEERTYTSSQQGGAKLDTGTSIAIVGALAVLTAVAIGVAATSDAPSLPMEYVANEVAVSHAPRIQIRPGEVLYVGHILMGLEVREKRIENPWGGHGPNAFDQSSTTTMTDKRIFAEHVFDVPQAQAFVAGLGLNRRSFRVQPLRLSSSSRTMLYNYAPPDPKLPVRTALARPDLPRAGGGPAPVAVTASPVGASATSKSLMERFLAGEISKEEYERARRAAGQ